MNARLQSLNGISATIQKEHPETGALLMAERQRFELWEGSPPRRFSRPLH